MDNLGADTVLDAFKKVLKDFDSPISELQVDAGGEFKNKKFQTFLKK